MQPPQTFYDNVSHKWHCVENELIEKLFLKIKF